MDAAAAFPRNDAPGAGRYLGRLAAKVLAGKLPPATGPLAEAVDIGPADHMHAALNVTLNFTVSSTCLLGRCRTGGSGVCGSLLCEHECHGGQHAAAARVRR